MDEKKNKKQPAKSAAVPPKEAVSAFPGAARGAKSMSGAVPAATSGPIPSQPRSYTPPMRGKGRSEPAATPAEIPEPSGAPNMEAEEHEQENASAIASSIENASPAKPGSSVVTEQPGSAGATQVPVSAPASTLPSTSASTSQPQPVRLETKNPAGAPPQSSGAGGDTIRLRVNPRAHAASTFPTGARATPKTLRQRLPDIRRAPASASAGAPRYGPISLFFGFLWLIFKMVFFTVVVMGLAAGLGFLALTAYIKTPEVTVPNVSGMKINEAFDVLSDKELGIKKIGSESSGLVAPGEIISQAPPAGSKSKAGVSVGVKVSSGRARFVVPSVVGESRENAVNKIKGAGLEIGNILMLEDSNIPKDQVISQTPSANAGLDEPTKVDLMVSSGAPGKSLTMPEVAGRTVAEAKAALRVLGITDITMDPVDSTEDAAIVSQEPLVGKSIFQSDKVTLRTK